MKIKTTTSDGEVGKSTATKKPKKIGCMFVPPRPDPPDMPKAGPTQNC
jgi:hypothetical protein